MKPACAAYRILSSGLFMLLLPTAGLYRGLSGRHGKGVGQRLGIYPDVPIREPAGRTRIWLHAASVGEVGVAGSVMDAMRRRLPESRIILSTNTEHGLAFARSSVGREAVCVYAPLDFIPCVRKALAAFKPRALVFMETEIWPNWIMEARRMGIKTAMVNGRISVRSIKRYMKVRGIMKETLGHMDLFSMIDHSDARRIRKIGAPDDRISVNGNAKYDLLIRRADPALKASMLRLYRLEKDQPVVVAGSVRSPEDEIVLDAYSRVAEQYPETLLIFAPRHVNRAGQIRESVRHRGFSCQLRTEMNAGEAGRSARVVVLDTIGELAAAYSIATLSFCGGSLVPLGGQNVLEAAVWGRPVLYGPSMEDFEDAKRLLERTGGGMPVADGQALSERMLHFLAHPREADAVGRRARNAVASHAGAAGKHADVICRLLGSDRGDEHRTSNVRRRILNKVF